ncbi:TIR domain-containing protein [Gelidibacter sp. F63206]|uniref:TIR domain-containing protein n=1 Tax=Gelidibacter sp. F63206 TaxID=2926425 RepID=UPI001FF656C8|nr:TIR domain-containing protein [Gelidibacter sp. F63206]MCK0115334.1 toll/interleukin-1 receptor domain-containing protein [Gelidibacter sp. F63206]
MGIYSSSYLKDIALSKKRLFEQKLFSAQNVSENKVFDIFLSHSFLDREEVQGLYQELTDFGYSVYVDWIVDPHLDRSNVTKESASLVRKRMKCSKSLLLAISVNASMSKWIPWELGYVDGSTNRCAIIPVAKERIPPKSFEGKEYLSLYPFIKKLPVSGTNEDKLWVIEAEYSYSQFDTWFSDGIIKENRSVNIFNI